jgi:Uma2 family endonuclease
MDAAVGTIGSFGLQRFLAAIASGLARRRLCAVSLPHGGGRTTMTVSAPKERMTADAFTAWALEQPSGRFELAHGIIVAMAPERSSHALVKGAAYRALSAAADARGGGCVVYPDGMAVRIDDMTQYEPDAAVRCGGPLDADAVVYDDPVIVVEVTSPSTRAVDTGAKLVGYFRLPSLRHYLVVDVERRAVVHHRRGEDGAISTRILAGGTLSLDPPGFEVDLAHLFAGQ